MFANRSQVWYASLVLGTFVAGSATAQSAGGYAPGGPLIVAPDGAPLAAGGKPAGAAADTVPAAPAMDAESIGRIIEKAPAGRADVDLILDGGSKPSITWRLVNPFRFFTDPRDTEVHRATYEALRPGERLTPVLSAERALASRHDDGWAATMIDRTCWDGDKNRYVCSAYDDYMNPKTHAVRIAVDGIAEAAAVECQWSIVPHKGSDDVAPTTLLQSCAKPLDVEVPYPAGSAVTLSIGGLEVARETIAVRDLLIVGMGDSFASGEGNPDVPVRFSRERAATYGGNKQEPTAVVGYPARVGAWSKIGDKEFIKANARWLDQACHRSLYSHQLRAALQLAIEEPHRAVTFVGLACSGAEVTEGLFLRYKGNEWVPNPPDLSQISAAAVAQCGKDAAEPQDLPEAYHMKGAVPELQGGLVLYKCPVEKARKIDLVFVSIGGNDVGFARILANAILTDQSMLRKLGGWMGQVHGQSQATPLMRALDERYKSLNRALHNILHLPWRETDRVLLTGYPGLALLGDGRGVCPDGAAGMDVVKDFSLNSAKVREGVWISDRLHRIMQGSAKRHGWTMVEAHRPAFFDRGICAGFSDNSFSIADDLRLPRKIDGQWVPYNPADYQPYAMRQRWFRTPNDAFLTGNFHVSQSILQKALKLESLSWFQLVLAATYSGAFHPTAEGHAAIADAVVERSRGVLARYGQGPKKRPDMIAEPN
ncbi:MAG: hypothetical protein ACK4MF_04995 [Hyphomicrobiaceae bacterium]